MRVINVEIRTPPITLLPSDAWRVDPIEIGRRPATVVNVVIRIGLNRFFEAIIPGVELPFLLNLSA